jgi:hypothetical protein
MLRTLVFLSLLLIPEALLAEEVFVATFVPRPGTGSTASGTATFTLNDLETTIAFDISISGLSGAEIAAHVHAADGSIAYPLPPGLHKTGTWQNPGGLNVIALGLEQLYILIHTDPNPFGEIRGDLLKPSTATEKDTWGAIKALYR